MEEATLDRLAQRQYQLIFTYAPAGLGHLRVADALYHGLPEIVNPVVLGSHDKSIQRIHRITSINPLFRKAFEWFQSGPLASFSNRQYRASLRANTRDVHEELAELIDNRLEPPQEVLVVSTHFGLAHKLAAIKDRLQAEKHVRLFLAVVVTDATFQHIWYVDGADLIVVPSHFVKDQYVAYGKSLGIEERIEVLPYPVRLNLGTPLGPEDVADRIGQLNTDGERPIRVSIPISGAAVGTDYFLMLMKGLMQRSERFVFHVVSKDAPYTSGFLSTIESMQWVDVHVSGVDREVVDAYDDLLEEVVISLEVTKPSEQAFKALLGAELRGGVLLLFSAPVGKQEFDNLDFLRQHYLVPSTQTNTALWQMADDASADGAAPGHLLDEACTWRGVMLPADAQSAARFIWWMLKSGVFAQMATCRAGSDTRDEHPDELGADGVTKFWNLVASA